MLTSDDLVELFKAHVRRLSKKSEWRPVKIAPGLKSATHVLIMTIHNEMTRIPYFLKYYRNLGVQQFIIIDNNSDDGLADYIRNEADISHFYTEHSYKESRFGNDWINGIASKYCQNKWLLYVDADEFLIFPHDDKNNLIDLTKYFETIGKRSLQCIMLDMYSENKVSQNYCPPGDDPVQVCPYYDRDGYQYGYDKRNQGLWIKGGVRVRLFFSNVNDGPALNKTPLVFWKKHYAFIKSAHQVAPGHLNYGGDKRPKKITGALLHMKFISDLQTKLSAEAVRQQHTQEYNNYLDKDKWGGEGPDFMGPMSSRFEGWRSLEKDGLISDDGTFSK